MSAEGNNVAIAFVALCVGVSVYDPRSLRAGEGELHHAASDAVAIADWLRSVFGKIGIVEHLTNAEATKSNITDAVERFSKYKPSLFVFYFSGHGRSLDGDAGLIGYGSGYAEARIGLEDCYRLLDTPRAQRTLAIVDACHAGHVMQACGFFSILGSDKGRVFLAASDSVALESQRVENSIFTAACLDALGRIRGKQQGFIDVEAELFPILSF